MNVHLEVWCKQQPTIGLFSLYEWEVSCFFIMVCLYSTFCQKESPLWDKLTCLCHWISPMAITSRSCKPACLGLLSEYQIILEGQHNAIAFSTPLIMNHIYTNLHVAVSMHFEQSIPYWAGTRLYCAWKRAVKWCKMSHLKYNLTSKKSCVEQDLFSCLIISGTWKTITLISQSSGLLSHKQVRTQRNLVMLQFVSDRKTLHSFCRQAERSLL